jgi:hypothetical protein
MLPSPPPSAIDPVLDALVRYAEALLPGLKMRPISFPVDQWVRQDTHFIRMPKATVHWPIDDPEVMSDPALAEEERISALAALSGDPVLSGRMDQLVGWAGGLTSLTETQVLHAPISRALAESGGEPDRSTLTRHYTKALTDLRADTLEFHTILPIAGLFGDVGQIQLADGVVLAQLPDDVVVKCISAGLLQPRFGSTPLIDSAWFGVVVSTSVPIVVQQEDVNGALSPSIDGEITAFWEGIVRHLDGAMATLRLHRPQRIAALGQLQFSNHWLQQGSMQYRATPQARPPWGTYELTHADHEPIRVLFDSLQSTKVVESKALQAALRRFGFADERAAVEDAFVDLMIAAEAFYLGFDGTDARSELALRLSLRAGSVEVEADARRSTFDTMRRAYNVRSKVVHGAAKPADLEAMAELTDEVRLILRRGLVKAVTYLGEGNSREGFFPDFSDLLSGSG